METNIYKDFFMRWISRPCSFEPESKILCKSLPLIHIKKDKVTVFYVSIFRSLDIRKEDLLS
jgi:hypothetical protein